MLNRFQRALVEVARVNGLTLPDSAAAAIAGEPPHEAIRVATTKPRALPEVTTTPTRVRPDRVLVLGSCGVLVRVKDGRLPRDGEVVPDGACLRLNIHGAARGGGHVLIASVLRDAPDSAKMRWAAIGELHAIDLQIVRAVAPSQLAEHAARGRVSTLAMQLLIEIQSDTRPTGDAEVDLQTALAVVQARREALDNA